MSFELVGIKLTADGYPQYMREVGAADKATMGFGSSSAGVFKQMPGLADIATGALHKIGAVAVDVFLKAGRAAVGFFTDSISKAGDFESGMNKFAAVAGGALEESGLKLKDFRDQFIQIGKELPVSTAEVQDAAIEMVKGGIEPATIAAGGLKQVIQFAAAADLDLAQASTIAAKALGGWVSQTATAQEKADFLTHSTDLLAKAANASTVNVDDLALGLYNVQGTAKLAGVSFDETVTALAELAPSFSSSADAGTSFKTFLARLQPTTKPAIAAMQDLGLATKDGASVFYDAQGNFVGMAKASQLLYEATKDLTPAQRELALQTIFGQDAIRTAAVFAEKGADGYNAMTASLAKQNSVAEMAKQKQAGFNTALDNFKGSVEALQITIGSYFLPVLTDLFNNYLAPGINTVTAFAESFFKMVPAILASDDPLQTFLNALKVAAPGLLDVIGAVESFKDSVIEFATPILDVAIPALQEITSFIGDNLQPILFGLATAITVAVIPAVVSATTAFVAAAAPIVALVAVGALLYKAWTEDWGGIQEITAQVWDTLQPIFEDVAEWLGDNIPKAIKVASDFWTGTLQPALSEVWAFINTKVIPVINTLVTVYFKAAETELKLLASFWTGTLLPAIKDVWGFLDKYVIPLFQAVARVEIAALKLALRELTNIWNDVLLPAITAVHDFFKNNIIPIFSDTGGGGSDLARSIRDTLGPAFTWLTDNVLKPVNEWFGKIGDAISGAIDWLNKLADTINNLPSLPDPFVGHSPPPIANWMSDIASSAALAADAIANVGGAIGGLPGGGTSRGIASTGVLMARGMGSSNAVYNQQRTTNLTYHTAVAPPVSHSMAIANALAGGS